MTLRLRLRASVTVVSGGSYEPSPWQLIADHVDRYLATDGADGFEWEGAPCRERALLGC